ncbi:MAG TPA: chemotaxis-specific protein-glutamate methyltransferase CheB [Polyangiaceae bacterium]|jgi:two-component system chemotaxis response regulator CheB|nr:chemotaxis-specific protein-glutamate methyltransferase CheB [Polyangiaceae bacterium]
MTTTRVLVVDDSAFARKVVRESLQTSPQIEVVGIARDGIDALEKIAALEPDVITLDLVMPNLDGLGVLAALTPAQRARVIVVSMADGESDIGVSALAFGVFDLVHKPTALAVASLHDIAEELVAKVLLAAAQPPGRTQEFETVTEPPLAPSATSERIVLIGTSTGGPQALTRLLKAFPANFPAPIAIVLHIPAGYTGPLAERLNAECALEVLEAQHGLELRPGRAVLAQAGLHMRLLASGDAVTVRLDSEPSSALHRPSVDVLFQSAASLGPRILAVVLTGMGEDGLAGSHAIAETGGQILTEAEASCVVYGMPRAVKEAGLSSAEEPLDRMARAITARL